MNRLEYGLVITGPDNDSSMELVERNPAEMTDEEYLRHAQDVGAGILSNLGKDTRVRVIPYQPLLDDTEPMATPAEARSGQVA